MCITTCGKLRLDKGSSIEQLSAVLEGAQVPDNTDFVERSLVVAHMAGSIKYGEKSHSVAWLVPTVII
jgi:hypothetical protein